VTQGAVEAVEKALARPGDADDALREVVRVLADRTPRAGR
jgi:hypothetical protein